MFASRFPGDPPTPEELPEWYEPHIMAWSDRAVPLTTLWFWNTEIGWANVHPLLVKYGWREEWSQMRAKFYNMHCTRDDFKEFVGE